MRIPKDSFLLTTPIAHRGAFDENAGIPENSISAFERAIALGYAIETDVRTTKDGALVLFHDAELRRMTGQDGIVRKTTLSELKELSLGGGKEKIPTFSEFLELVNGKTPLLIEIKDVPRKSPVKEVLRALEGYRGEFALQSFHPLYINEIRKRAPHILRGQLGCGSEHFSPRNYFLKQMPLHALTKPDFISYDVRTLPSARVAALRENGTLVLGWTVRSEEERERIRPYTDNIIFEKITPPRS